MKYDAKAALLPVLVSSSERLTNLLRQLQTAVLREHRPHCHFPPYRRHHGVFGVMEPRGLRRNGATSFSAYRSPPGLTHTRSEPGRVVTEVRATPGKHSGHDAVGQGVTMELTACLSSTCRPVLLCTPRRR